MAEEKPCEPTATRIRKAREEGNVLKGQLLTQVAALCGAILAVALFGTTAWVKNEMLLQCAVYEGLRNASSCVPLLAETVAYGCLSVLVLSSIFGTVCDVLQIGVRCAPSLLSPRASRCNPEEGLKKIGRGVLEGWELVLKVAIVGTVAVSYLWNQLPEILALSFSAESLVQRDRLAGMIRGFLGRVVAALLALALLELMLRRRRYRRDLSMTHDEVRREQKDTEGDPLFRAVRKGMHEAMLMQDLERRVRNAKVIVVERS